jgi:hypothetical protein
VNLRDFGLAEAILNAMPNLYSTKEIINWPFTKCKIPCFTSMIKKVKTSHRKYLQITYLKRDVYPECKTKA